MPQIQKNIDEANRFKDRVKKQRRADRFRFMVILGISLVIIMVILIWAVATGYSDLSL